MRTRLFICASAHLSLKLAGRGVRSSTTGAHVLLKLAGRGVRSRRTSETLHGIDQ